MDEAKTTPQQVSTPQIEVPPEIAQFLKRLAEEVARQGRFTDAYANNFRFEPSLWDFKIVFGELDQGKGESFINWHTAVTIPWLQVKLVTYFLRLNLAWYEHQNGRVILPASAIPKQPVSAELPDDLQLRAWQEIAKELYNETFEQD